MHSTALLIDAPRYVLVRISFLVLGRLHLIISFSVSTLLSLPNETLDEVLENSEASEIVSLARVCKRLHPISSRILYRTVVVVDENACLFCGIMAAPSRRSINYSIFIRSLSLVFTDHTHPSLAYPILTHALRHLAKLESLTLVIPTGHSTYCLQRLKAMDLIRTHSTEMARLNALLNGSSTGHVPTLPMLSRLTLQGDIRLIEIAAHRDITSLELMQVASYHDFRTVLDTLTNRTSPNHVLWHLVLMLGDIFMLNEEVVRVYHAIASALPMMERLTVFVPEGNVMVRSFNTVYFSYTR